MVKHLDSHKAEILVRWFLRFNGYFTVENFIAHDARRIYNKNIGCSTEFDVLAIRLPHSRETVDNMHIVNFPDLVDGQGNRNDIIIADAKTGKQDKPNENWKHKKIETVEYALRFIGSIFDEGEISLTANHLLTNYAYQNNNCRYRYIIFAEQENSYYENLGVKYITYNSIIQFLINTRGPCWILNKTGIKSIHDQWDPLIKNIFAICNENKTPAKEKESIIFNLLRKSPFCPLKNIVRAIDKFYI